VYTIIQRLPRVGKTQWVIRHSCGAVLTVYLWSFAASGKRCPDCKQIIKYLDRE